MDPSLIATFALLVGVELALGIDNILFISLITDRLPPERRAATRRLGLSLAVGLRGPDVEPDLRRLHGWDGVVVKESWIERAARDTANGLGLNFNVLRLKDGIRRLALSPPPLSRPASSAPSPVNASGRRESSGGKL